MKKEYDFSKGQRGRFYRKGAALNLPIYLDKKNRDFVEQLAKRTNRDISDVTNDLIRANQTIFKTIR
jgi:hypothetical protein